MLSTSLGGNQLVVVLDHIDQFNCGDIVGFQPQRVDQHLDHLIAVASDACFEHRIKRFDVVLQVLGKPCHGAFGHRAGHVHDDDRELGKVDLVDRVFLCPFREVGLGGIHGIAHIRHHCGLVPAEIEFQRHTGIAFGGGCGHLVEPVEVGKLGFHHLDQQGLRILGRDAGEGDGDEQGGDLDVGLALLGQADIGKAANQQ